MNDLHCCIIDQDLEKAYKARKLADKSDFVFRAGTKENMCTVIFTSDINLLRELQCVK